MKGIQTAQHFRFQDGRPLTDSGRKCHENQRVKDCSCLHHLLRCGPSSRPQKFSAQQVAREQAVITGGNPSTQRCCALLGNDQFRCRRGVQVEHFQYRSASRISSNTSDTDGRPRRRAAGAGRSPSLRSAGRAFSAATNASIRPEITGTIIATGRPRSVIVITSPAATSATTAEAFCFNALTPTSDMFYIVAQRPDRPPAPTYHHATQ
jgi:hypothetical protein